MTFYDAYNFLEYHEIFKCRFLEGLDLLVVKVDPETNSIENDSSRNTKTRIWLKAGPCLCDDPNGVLWGHDFNLDCAGDTFEEAIIKLAELVEKHYGSKMIEDDGPFKIRSVIL